MDLGRAARRAAFLAALLAGSGTLAFAEPPADRCAAETWEPARILEAAHGDPAALDLFPESASAIRRLLAAAHSTGDSARIRAGAARLAEMGYALAPHTLDQLAVHFTPGQAAALRQGYEANRAALGSSRLVATVPAGRPLVEGIARDRRTGRLFATSVVGRELLVRGRGEWRAVPGVAAGSLFGMAMDGSRRLWIASGTVEQTPSPGTAFRGLIALDLDRLRVVERIPVEGPGSPGDVAIGPEGTIYASDSVSGAVYRALPGARTLSLLVPPGRLGSPQGLAVSADGRRLFVADYAYGIAAVDLAGGRITRLAARGIAMLDGIDGLLADGEGLIVIQNGTSPRRILRLRLDPDCAAVTAVEVIERANPEWGEPTLGTIDGGELLYVADAQWERYGPAGAVRGEGPTRPTAIRALRLPRRVARSAQ
jgi:sugar lactone lactonase YvrE